MKAKENVLSKTVSVKALFLIMLFCLAVLLIPMLCIAGYDAPSVDDFCFGAATHHTYTQTGSIAKTLLTAVKETLVKYNTWQGSYSAVFLMHIQPAVFGEQLYPITPYLMLTAILGGLFFLCYTVFGKVFGADKLKCALIALVGCILYTQFVPMAASSFYWFNGSVYYTLFEGLALICYGLIIRYICDNESKKRRYGLKIGIILLLAFIGGGNYPTALSTAELLFFAVVFLLIRKNPKWKTLTAFLLVFMLSFMISVVAPGNAVRGGENYLGNNAVSAIMQSFKTAASYVLKWTSLPVAAFTALLVPLFLSFCDKTQFRFRLPALVSLLSFCLVASMFCPPLYAQGYFAFRLLNIIFYAYIFLLFLNVFYWLGWAARKFGERATRHSAVKVWFLTAVLILFAVGSGLMTASGNISLGNSRFLSEKRNVTSAYAMVTLLNGGGKRYYEQNDERFVILKDDSIKDVELQPFDYCPGLLFISDISEDETDWRNVGMCEFYDKNTARLSEPYPNNVNP